MNLKQAEQVILLPSLSHLPFLYPPIPLAELANKQPDVVDSTNPHLTMLPLARRYPRPSVPPLHHFLPRAVV